jgi:osmoprotectant transport system substrate-binding protein
MIRKHTRRAVKAAFAIPFGVALLIGGAASAGVAATAQKPTVVIGTKNFTEEYILGQLYKQALEAKGFNVSYKENIGSTEIIDTALTSGKINFYPEYTGTILTAVFHKPKTPGSAVAVYSQAKQLEEKRGFTLFKMTPFYDRDEIGVLTSTAKKYKLHSVGDLKKVDNLVVCALPEFATRLQGAVGLKQVYGVSGFTFKPLASISAYELLDQGNCTAADVFSTDAQLLGTKYALLKDTKNLFGFQNVAPVVSAKLASELGPTFRQTVDAVSAKLTLPAMIAMNKAVAIDKKSPKDVAAAFLKANNLT